MNAQGPVVIDYETEAVDARPNYPPMPVGVSIKYPNKAPRYYAFGHPEANNCTPTEAAAAVAEAWEFASEHGLLCHNAKFDYDVAQTWMGMPDLPWDKIHDTMMEVFLFNPDAKSHGLKQSAEALLNMPPEERDAVREWLIANHVITRQSKDAGAYICRAPGDIVGAYANGDVVRTEKLHKFLMPKLKKLKMLDALDTERELMPILLDMERQGVPVDMARLLRDCDTYAAELKLITEWCLKRIKAKGRLRNSGKFKGKVTPTNLDSGDDLVAALIEVGKVDTNLLGKTDKGAWKTDKDALARAITDKVLSAMLNHRASLQTCLGTFMQPWLATARESGGLIFTTWNQLKQYGKGAAIGAVTGRLSSSPNFQNIPKEFKPLWKHQALEILAKAELELKEDPGERSTKEHAAAVELVKVSPKCPLALSPLPLVRSYIVSSDGGVLLCRDYSQQEIRILAHYEDGLLKEAYLQDAWMDAHGVATEEINGRLSKSFDRSVIKQINFGLIYGMGIQLMADKAGCEAEEARAAKQAVLAIYPGLKDLQDGLRTLAREGQPLRTWGGRLYHCEDPKVMPDGSTRTFEYKMLNRLVQGSAADQTKRAIINYYKAKPEGHKLLLTVHDEVLADVPAAEAEEGMTILQAAMEFKPFDIPMLSEGKTSTTNWASLKTWDKKGKRV